MTTADQPDARTDRVDIVIEAHAGGRLHIGTRDARGTGHGYRIAGPKYGGYDHKLLASKTLTRRDVDEIESYLRTWHEHNPPQQRYTLHYRYADGGWPPYDESRPPLGTTEDQAIALAHAAAARAEVETLAQRRADLEQVDQARAVWRVHTAVTRDWADRADAELKSRGVDVTAEPHVTAPEWDDARHQHDADEDAHRQVRNEYELADVVDTRATDAAIGVDAEPALDAPDRSPEDTRTAPAPAAADLLVETAVGDVRDVAAARAEVERAQAALAEIRARDASDAARSAEEADHAEELRWTPTDVREHEDSEHRVVDDDGALQR